MAGAGSADGAGPPWPGGAAWAGGRYCPVEDARISVLDLGVTRSDATYDVVHVRDGRFFRLADHLDRFTASLARLRLDPGCDRGQIEDIVHGCVRHAGLREAYVPASGTLAGITRRTVIELARHDGQPVEEGPLSQGDLRRAGEVLITSTAGGVMPVTTVDGQPVGDGTPGPRTGRLRDLYWASHADPRYATPVRYDQPD